MIERPGERDVIDVVPGGLRIRSVLPPAGHAPEDELRIVLEQHIGAEAQPLHHARTIAFDQPVGALAKVAQDIAARLALHIDRDRAAAARQHVALRHHPRICTGPLDPDHLGTMIGQHHARERPRPDPGHFDDAQSCKRSGHAYSLDFPDEG